MTNFVEASHILVKTEEEAKNIKMKLKQGRLILLTQRENTLFARPAVTAVHSEVSAKV